MTAALDEKRGHFFMQLPHRTGHDTGRNEVIGADLGPTLHLTTHGAHLTPDEARDLASALTWWADRPRREPADLKQATDEAHDLLDLLGEA